MSKKQRCALASVLTFGFMTFLLVAVSLICVNEIHENWRAVDDWFAWAAGLSLLGAVPCAITTGISIYQVTDCEP